MSTSTQTPTNVESLTAYKDISLQILSELSTNLNQLPDDKIKLFSEYLSTFYLYALREKVIVPYPSQSSESLYLSTLGVLTNHFLNNPPPQPPSQLEPFPTIRSTNE